MYHRCNKTFLCTDYDPPTEYNIVISVNYIQILEVQFLESAVDYQSIFTPKMVLKCHWIQRPFMTLASYICQDVPAI
ncbi:hypothetical protein T08_4553 [Trichinella sp. T8]|nr:hypothetical protein T08_4553 [Trichinella sp. T8]